MEKKKSKVRSSLKCRLCDNSKMLINLNHTNLKFAVHYRSIVKNISGVEFTEGCEAIVCQRCISQAVEWHEFRTNRMKKFPTCKLLSAHKTKVEKQEVKDEAKEQVAVKDETDEDDDVQLVAIAIDITDDDVDNIHLAPTSNEAAEETQAVDANYKDIDEDCSTPIKIMKIAFPRLKVPVALDQSANLCPIVKLDNQDADSCIAMLRRKAREKVQESIDMDTSENNNCPINNRLDVPEFLPEDGNQLKSLFFSSLQLQSIEESTPVLQHQQVEVDNVDPIEEMDTSNQCDGQTIENGEQSHDEPVELVILHCETETKDDDESHINTVSGPSKRIPCQLCSKTYKTKKGLYRHNLVEHEGCERCHIKGFKSFAQRDQHKLLHEKEDSFPVPFVNIVRLSKAQLQKYTSTTDSEEEEEAVETVETEQPESSNNDDQVNSSPQFENTCDYVCELSPYSQFSLSENSSDEPAGSGLQRSTNSVQENFMVECLFVQSMVNERMEVSHTKSNSVAVAVQADALSIRLRYEASEVILGNVFMSDTSLNNLQVLYNYADDLMVGMQRRIPPREIGEECNFADQLPISVDNYRNMLPLTEDNLSSVREIPLKLKQPLPQPMPSRETQELNSQKEKEANQWKPQESNSNRASVIHQLKATDLTKKNNVEYKPTTALPAVSTQQRYPNEFSVSYPSRNLNTPTFNNHTRPFYDTNWLRPSTVESNVNRGNQSEMNSNARSTAHFQHRNPNQSTTRHVWNGTSNDPLLRQFLTTKSAMAKSRYMNSYTSLRPQVNSRYTPAPTPQFSQVPVGPSSQFVQVAPMVQDARMGGKLSTPKPMPTAYQRHCASSNYPRMNTPYVQQDNMSRINQMPMFTQTQIVPVAYSSQSIVPVDESVLPTPIIQFNYVNWQNGTQSQLETAPRLQMQSMIPTINLDQVADTPVPTSTPQTFQTMPTPARANILRVKTTGELNNYTGAF